MSGPAGSGAAAAHHGTPLTSRLNLLHQDSSRSTSSAGFGGLVHKLQQKKHSGESQDPTPDGVRPSKKLPSTGLKRNTQEWKEQHGEGDADDGLRRHRSRASSSSSIPSDARSDATPEREEDQEGPLGNGPGRHERRILDNGKGRVFDSPTEEKSSIADDQNSPPMDRDEDRSLVPGSANHEDGERAARGGGHRDAGEGAKETIDERDKHEGGSNRLTYGDDPEQKVISRDQEPYKRLTDEVGGYPMGLKGVKGEEPPGPRTEIVLDPRITHIHVSDLLLRHLPY